MEFQRGRTRYPFKPVKEGEEYEVKITDTSRRGDGIAKIEGFIIFVPGTKLGDHVKIQISSVRPRFATASVIE
ncbi:TPA: TRAM domain-containing protein [Candidatus Bathyarchaeota archaeon]|nr:TRAM domain-containing protein [Candidatus Bathyarchaeota archaeon]